MNVIALTDLSIQGFGDGTAGLIRRVENPTNGVTAFHRQMELSKFIVGLVVSQIKVDALIDQPVDHFLASLDRESNGVLMAKSGARAERVLNVCLHGVSFVQNRGHAPLRPRGRTRIQVCLGEQSD